MNNGNKKLIKIPTVLKGVFRNKEELFEDFIGMKASFPVIKQVLNFRVNLNMRMKQVMSRHSKLVFHWLCVISIRQFKQIISILCIYLLA